MSALPARKFTTPPPEEGFLKTPELKAVPLETETESGSEDAMDAAEWVQLKNEFGIENKEHPERKSATNLMDLTEEMDTLIAQRSKIEQNIKRLDSPIHKVAEALGKIGFLKDTVAAFSKWKQERAQLEDTLDSIDRLVVITEQQIKQVVAQREAGMQKQSVEIAKGSSAPERELIEKWFYNRSTEGGAVSEEARKEWEAIEQRTETIDEIKYIERRAIDSEVVAGLKGLDKDDQAKMDNWFVDPDKFVETVDDDLEVMVQDGQATKEDRAVWKKNELPADTREAIETRIQKLKEETAQIEHARAELERQMMKGLAGTKHPELFHEKIRFDEVLRSQYLGGWMKRLFKNSAAGADTFLRLEPELRKVEAIMAINNEAIRRAELTLKDPHAAAREAAVRELNSKLGRAKSEKASSGGIPGGMREAA